MQHIAEALRVETAMVAFNGAALFLGDTIIASAPFNMERLRPTLEEADRLGATVIYYTVWEAFAFRKTDWVTRAEQTIRRYTIAIPTEDEWRELEILKVAILYHNDEQIHHAIDSLLDAHEDAYSFSRYGTRFCEIMRRGVDKAYGLRGLAAHLGIPLARILAVGDDLNDVTMLEEAGIGVAVNNALDEVKAAADHVTRAQNTDGVVEAINTFL
jgi:Cof subfamily protein (haloacid dehalogenase superfamily)